MSANVSYDYKDEVNMTLLEINKITNHVLNYVDYTIRAMGLLVHLVYFLLLLRVVEMRKITLVYLHHVNLISFLYCVHYMFYIKTRNPNLGNDYVDDIICTLSELFWTNIKIMRIFSLLLLSTYRYLAVFKINTYKRLNNSKLAILGAILITWLVSLCLSLSVKYSLQTSYTIWFCIDGKSDNMINSIVYYSLFVAFVIFSSVGICIAYVAITRKLNGLSVKTNSVGSQLKNVKSKSSLPSAMANFKFAKQFLALNILTFSASVFSLLIDFNIIILSFPSFEYMNGILEYLRPCLRMVFIVLISCIPISSLYFLPVKEILAFLSFSYFHSLFATNPVESNFRSTDNSS